MMVNMLIVAGILWIFLSVFSFMQSIHLRNIYNVLSEKGRIVTGQDRGLFRTQYRLFVAVSPEGIVTDGRILKVVRFVTVPKVFECPRLIGLDLNRFDPETVDTDPRIQLAAENLKVSWAKRKPTLERNTLSIGNKTRNEITLDTDPHTREEESLSDNKDLYRAGYEIRTLLANDELNINKEPLKMLWDALHGCDKAYCFGTDEVIADKAFQLRCSLTAKGIDVPKVDGLIETMFRLITQREREADFRREHNPAKG